MYKFKPYLKIYTVKSTGSSTKRKYKFKRIQGHNVCVYTHVIDQINYPANNFQVHNMAT